MTSQNWWTVRWIHCHYVDSLWHVATHRSNTNTTKDEQIHQQCGESWYITKSTPLKWIAAMWLQFIMVKWNSMNYIGSPIESQFNSYSASHDNWCTVGGDGGCRVGEVRAGTTSPMPDHKGFKLQWLVNFQKFSTLRVKTHFCCWFTELLHKDFSSLLQPNDES